MRGYLLAVLAVLAGCVLQGTQGAEATQGTGVRASLVVVAEKGDEQASVSDLMRKLGAFDRERTPVLEERFLLVNRGRETVEIAKLQGSCGCTDLLLLSGDRRSATPKP